MEEAAVAVVVGAAAALHRSRRPRMRSRVDCSLPHLISIGSLQKSWSGKTHEVRNFYCRVVGKSEQIYLVQSGLKDPNGKGVFCVRGKAEFRGNTFVPHQEFSKHYAKHRCSAAEYSSVRSSWVDKGGCVLWEFKLLEVFDQPLYFRPKQGEEQLHASEFSSFRSFTSSRS